MKIIVLILCLTLAGCAVDNTAQLITSNRIESCNHYNSIWVKKAECLNETARSDTSGMFHDQGAQEIIAYRQLLIEKVHSKRMTNAEADYAFQKKISEMNRQLAQQRALQPVIVQTTQQPNYQPNLIYQRSRVNTTCQQLGNQVSCQSTGVAPLDTSALDPR